MPSLTFVLPHWLYWAGLVAFPLIAMYLVRRRQTHPVTKRVTMPIAAMLWLCGGFLGLHRFYVRSRLGVVYIPFFITILYANKQGRGARNAVSTANNDLAGATFEVEHFSKLLEDGVASAAQKLDAAKSVLITAKQLAIDAGAAFAQWEMVAGGAALVIVAMLLLDAFLLPKLVRQCDERERSEVPIGPVLEHVDLDAIETSSRHDPAQNVHTPFTNVVDRISGFTGEFVAYWSLIAVFIYYYEVIARYVFNSPTNWAHEGMFLMFGMQYLISGAYALREDSHVRVDVIYSMLSERAKVITDVITSIFFFIFTTTLLVTGWIFMSDSIDVFEVSFTEWAIQYWPVKVTVALGAFLLLLQGISKLVKDLHLLTRQKA